MKNGRKKTKGRVNFYVPCWLILGEADFFCVYLSFELYGLNHDAAKKLKENTGIFFQKIKRPGYRMQNSLWNVHVKLTSV